MRWIVDGMNVIGSRPDGWWRDRTAAMRRLVEELSTFAARTGDDVRVVLDGGARDLGDAPAVEVVWAPGQGPNAADRVIVELVEADSDPGSLTVVTSDAALADRARRAGAAVTGAGGFRATIGR